MQWAGPARHHAPGIRFDDLPPIDLVLISHDHYDHLDTDTLRALAERGDPLVVAGLGNGPLVSSLGLRVKELDWDQSITVGPLTVTGQRSRHFSGRGLFDRTRTLWLAYVFEGPSGRVYAGGDTGFGSHFAQTGERFGSIDLALLPIGAYDPVWFMGPMHMEPEDAVRAHQQLRARHSVGIHHGTFQLTEERRTEPAERLRAEVGRLGMPDDVFRVLAPGEAWRVPAGP